MRCALARRRPHSPRDGRTRSFPHLHRRHHQRRGRPLQRLLLPRPPVWRHYRRHRRAAAGLRAARARKRPRRRSVRPARSESASDRDGNGPGRRERSSARTRHLSHVPPTASSAAAAASDGGDGASAPAAPSPASPAPTAVPPSVSTGDITQQIMTRVTASLELKPPTFAAPALPDSAPAGNQAAVPTQPAAAAPSAAPAAARPVAPPAPAVSRAVSVVVCTAERSGADRGGVAPVADDAAGPGAGPRARHADGDDGARPEEGVRAGAGGLRAVAGRRSGARVGLGAPPRARRSARRNAGR